MRAAALVPLLLFALPAGGLADDGHARRPFPEVRNTQPAGDEPNTPLEAAAAFTVPDGFNVTLFAGEPDVAQPIALTFDDRGRLWVAECFTYTGRGYDVSHGDRVTIFEDRDGDGVHDSRKVFWDRGFMLTGLEYGFGGLWVLNDGTLSFIPDENGDDVPDGEPVVMLDGFTHEAEHNVVSGLIWGPDGWLYGRHGILATSHVGVPGTPEEDRTKLNCGVWRFHPTRHEFEVVARGTTNPWGLDYNEYGDWFMTNNVIGHAWHVIPGAHYRRMYGTDFNPHLYGLIDQHADHYHWDATGGDWLASRPGSAKAGAADDLGGGHSHSGGMIYQGDNWPAEYRGDLFMCNTHGKRVNRDALVPHGSGYVIEHRPDFAFANSPWFKGVELKSGPDGGVFLLDWTDLGECHDHDGVHRTSGRIYKIAYGTPDRAGEAVDLGELKMSTLVETALHHPNVWHRRHAGRLVIEPSPDRPFDEEGETFFLPFPEDDEGLDRLRAARLVAAALLARTPSATFDPGEWRHWFDIPSACGDDDDPRVRAAAIGLSHELSLVFPDPDGWYHFELERAMSDPDPRVRLAVASELQRSSVWTKLNVGPHLYANAADADDHNLPLMIWYGMEPAVAELPAEAGRFAAHLCKIPLLREYTARRLASELPDERYAAPLGTLLSVAAHKDDAFRRDVLNGTLAALDGRRKVDPPPGWAEVQPVFLNSPDEAVRAAARRLGVLFGDGAALDELRAVVTDRTQSDETRAAAIRSLAEAKDAALLPDLLAILKGSRLEDRGVQPAAARATAAFDSPEAAALLIDRLPGFQNQTRDAAVAALVSRPGSARLLAEALPGLGVTAYLSADHVRSLRAFGDPAIDAVLDEHWGTTRSTPAEKLAEVAAWKAKLQDPSGADPVRGRVVYNQVCGRCHTLYGEGGNVGPNLTGSDRHNLDYILGNVMDPSATVPAAWRVSAVLLADGRALVGVVTRPDDRTVNVRTADAEIAVPADDILEVAPGEASLMPEGLFTTLDEGQVRDLVAYLRTDRPVSGDVGSGKWDVGSRK